MVLYDSEKPGWVNREMAGRDVSPVIEQEVRDDDCETQNQSDGEIGDRHESEREDEEQKPGSGQVGVVGEGQGAEQQRSGEGRLSPHAGYYVGQPVDLKGELLLPYRRLALGWEDGRASHSTTEGGEPTTVPAGKVESQEDTERLELAQWFFKGRTLNTRERQRWREKRERQCRMMKQWLIHEGVFDDMEEVTTYERHMHRTWVKREGTETSAAKGFTDLSARGGPP